MKGSREHKRWIAKVRRDYGKRNGVIGSWAFDDLWLFKLETDRKFRKVNRRPRDGYGKQRAE
jgi:hypothetical protein